MMFVHLCLSDRIISWYPELQLSVLTVLPPRDALSRGRHHATHGFFTQGLPAGCLQDCSF